jgi:DNA mismatch repair protein MutL
VTEFAHISEALLRLALPHPAIGFKLLHNGKCVLDLPAATQQQRWLAAWPEEFAQRHLKLATRDAEVSLIGLIGQPEMARPTPRHQYLYLNGRPIRDRFIQHALREAYRGLTEPGRHPAAILLVSMPPHDVDVNVHPTKSEVRFKDSGRIHGLVLSAVREKLLGSDLTPSAVAAQSFAPMGDDPARRGLREKLAEFFRSGLSEPWSPLPASISAQPPAVAASIVPDAQRPLPSAAIQLHNSYLVAQSDDGLIIIDQHALHERILYEDLLARVSNGPLESQRLLIPLTLPANPRQQELLEQIQPLMHRLGIEASAIGPDGVAVHAFPSFLQRLDPVEFIRQLLERGEQERLDLNQEELLHEILDMMACKAAVKAGDPLSPAEIDALLARRHLIDRSSNCPHGRPTTLRLTLRDLEKQFKRSGF